MIHLAIGGRNWCSMSESKPFACRKKGGTLLLVAAADQYLRVGNFMQVMTDLLIPFIYK